ncbi:MAG: hypothetical protein P4M04_09720 [Acidobacteriota bacterium]|nr:hypothetical protein [Acidobacteriota bacterium]
MTRFEERELPPYAEPVLVNELKEGSVYFFVNYVDEEGLIPQMETVIFIGRNLEAADVGRVYFQDIDSYRGGAAMVRRRLKALRPFMRAQRTKWDISSNTTAP